MLVEEYLDVVDENDIVIGKDTRENVHRNGLLHRDVHVWIFNKNGEILFQRRSEAKDTYPNLLSPSVGGHVEAGDDYSAAAMKELKEETGLEVDFKDLIFITKTKMSGCDHVTGMKNNTMREIYAYEFNGNVDGLKVEKKMATGFEFWKIDKIFNLSEKEREEFVPEIIDEKYISIFRKVKDLMGRRS